MAGVDFVLVLQVVAFLCAIWLGGRLFKICHQPAILGYLLVGIVMGPQLLDMVPYASDGTCDTWVNRRLETAGSSAGSTGSGGEDCSQIAWLRWTGGPSGARGGAGGSPIVNIWTFIGNVGVTLMIFQSGMHIHFDKVAQVGRKALVVAIFGTALPLLTGMAVVGGLTGEYYPSGFAAGCAFAPTSIDISIKLLDESKMLNSLAGQTTLTAAFIDDIFSLGTLVMMTSLAKGDTSPVNIVRLVLCSFGFLALGVFLAIKVFPHLPPLLSRIPGSKYASVQPRDEVHIFLMVATLSVCAYITAIKEAADGGAFIGSHLLGAFVAGMCFVNVPRSQQIWNSQMKRVVKWMVRFFFAASVGFAVPVSEMFTWDAFGNGLLLAIGPTIATKLFSGIFAYTRYTSPEAKARAAKASWITKYCHAQPQQLLVGAAMVARGEFAYMVADTAQSLTYEGGEPGQRMLAPGIYASVVWALVMATVASPILFHWALAVYGRATPIVRSRTIGGSGEVPSASDEKAEGKDEQDKHTGRGFVIRVASRHHIGVQRELLTCLHGTGVDVLEAHVYGVDHVSTEHVDAFVAQYVVISRGSKKDFDDEKLEEMEHALLEVLDDRDAQVIFEPYDDDFSKDGAVQIELLVQHHPDVLHEITDALATMGLDVLKADVTHTKQPVHGHTAIHAPSKPVSRANSFKGKMGGGTSASNEHFVAGHDVPTPRTRKTSKESVSTEAAMAVEAALNKREALDRMHDTETAFYAIEEKERAVFYAREADRSLQFTAARRSEIKAALEAIVHEHGLQGTVMVRVIHEDQMKMAHQLPQFDHEEVIAVIRSTGQHHKELLHEICDVLHDQAIDVIHAEMDTNAMGEEEHALYVSRCDDKPTDRAQRTMLRAAINELYLKHDEVSTEHGGFSVSVLPLRAEGGGAVVELPEKLTEKTGTTSTHTLASRTKSAKVAFGGADGGGALNGSAEVQVEMREVEAEPVISGAANV